MVHQSRSPEEVEGPRFLMVSELGVLVIMEGFVSVMAVVAAHAIGNSLGFGEDAIWALGAVFLVCFGGGKTWSNIRVLDMHYRGELERVRLTPGYSYVFQRPVLNAAIEGGADSHRWNDPSASTPDPLLLAGVGLGLPLFVLAGLSLSGNPYLVFLIPVAAYGVLYGVGRLGSETVRPRPYHVGLALTLTYSLIPFVLASIIVLYGTVLPALPDVMPYSVLYHFGYSPLHLILLPLAMFPVVYVSNYCLLLAYDVYRARRGVLPKILSEDAESTTEAPTATTTDEPDIDGDMSQLLWVFAPIVPVNAAIVAFAYGFRPAAAVGAVTVALLLFGTAMYIDDVPMRLGDPGSLVAGAAGGLVACATAYAVPLFYTPAVPYRYVVWLPVAALVGFVTGVLLYAAVGSSDGLDDAATARSG